MLEKCHEVLETREIYQYRFIELILNVYNDNSQKVSNLLSNKEITSLRTDILGEILICISEDQKNYTILKNKSDFLLKLLKNIYKQDEDIVSMILVIFNFAVI